MGTPLGHSQGSEAHLWSSRKQPRFTCRAGHNTVVHSPRDRTPLPFVAALVATLATNLLAGLVPIPGGIGVAEAVLTSFLIVFGLPPEEAFAAAVIFRIATFYIPAAEGFFAMKWLEKNGHL